VNRTCSLKKCGYVVDYIGVARHLNDALKEYDGEDTEGALIDITNRNSLGSARTLGLRTRYDAQLQEARLYFTQPLLRRFPVSTTLSPYVRHERNPATSTSDAFNVDRTGISIQQEAKFRRKYVATYGYRIEKSRTYDTGPDPFFNIPLRIAALTATVTRETRDDVLDATHGQFFSHAFQYSPELLGSQLRFVKYFGQYFRYFPLEKPKVQLFTNQVLRPRLVYATGVRVGLATGLGGQEITLGERFLAGGGTTMNSAECHKVGQASRLPRASARPAPQFC
jgi:outer membrane protein assembly factor BamA